MPFLSWRVHSDYLEIKFDFVYYQILDEINKDFNFDKDLVTVNFLQQIKQLRIYLNDLNEDFLLRRINYIAFMLKQSEKFHIKEQYEIIKENFPFIEKNIIRTK